MPPDAAVQNLSPELKALIDEGKERGFVTYDELNKVLPDDVVSPEKLDLILQKMEDLGIEMVESSGEKGEEASAADDGDREFEGPKELEPRQLGATAKIDDPVRLYLSQ